jgi:hypothetical protein
MTHGFVLAASVLVALVFHGLSVYRIESLREKTKGVIRTRQDLQAVKDVISLNMRMAIFYILFWLLLIAVLVGMVVTAMIAFPQALMVFFLFGVITLPMGLIGKHFEKKIHSLKVESGDPALAETFQRYLVQWKEPRFQLPED